MQTAELFFILFYKASKPFFWKHHFNIQLIKRKSALSCAGWSRRLWWENAEVNTSPSQSMALRWKLINANVKYTKINLLHKNFCLRCFSQFFHFSSASFSGSEVAFSPSGTILHLRNLCTTHYSACVHNLCLCKHSHLPHSPFWVPPLTNWLVKEAYSQTRGQVTSHPKICRHGQASVFAKSF